MELHEKIQNSDEHFTIHFIETSASLLHNVPYINTSVGDHLLQQNPNKPQITFKNEIKLVYGLQGISHFILIFKAIPMQVMEKLITLKNSSQLTELLLQ